MRRREFITLVGGAAAWPLSARAQQPDRTRRIGVLMAYAEGDREARAWIAAFRQELQKFGWTEDRSIRIEIRWATTDEALLQRFAKERIALQPDLIRSLAIFRLSSRPDSSLSSILRPPRRSVLRSRNRSCCAPTR